MSERGGADGPGDGGQYRDREGHGGGARPAGLAGLRGFAVGGARARRRSPRSRPRPVPTSVFFLPLDLADLSSVRACAEAFLARGEPLHVLVNNAGVGGQRGG